MAINTETLAAAMAYAKATAEGAGAIKGDKGDKGDTGRGVESLDVNASNHLIVTYDDDTTHDAGEIDVAEFVEHHAAYTEPFTSKNQYPPTITAISDTVVNVVADGNAYEGVSFTLPVLPNKTNAITIYLNNAGPEGHPRQFLFKPTRRATSLRNFVKPENYTKYDKTFFVSWDEIKDYVTEDNLLEVSVYCSSAFSADINIDVHYLEGKGTLYGKTVTFLGDSITTENYDWTKLFSLITESEKIVNVAVVGATLHNFADTVLDGDPKDSVRSSNTLPNQVQKLINNQYEVPDVVIIAIGINGGIYATQADIDNAYTTDLAELDLTKDADAFRWSTEKIRSIYPNAMIVWCNPIQGARAAVSNIVTYANNLRTLTAYGAVNNVETNRCGINQPEEADSYTHTVDGLHPNFSGSLLMAKYNAAAISQLFV